MDYSAGLKPTLSKPEWFKLPEILSFNNTLKIDVQRGFTLVELSIVIIIISLIIGGIVTGRDLVRSAEVRAVISQMERYNSAVNAFQAKYTCLPGDCTFAKATSFSLTATAAQMTTAGINTTCPAGTTGDGNGSVGTSSISAVCGDLETILFWQHLKDAGLFGDKMTSVAYEGNVPASPPTYSATVTNGIPAINFAAVSATTSIQAGIDIYPSGSTHLFWIATMIGTGTDLSSGGTTYAGALSPLYAYAIDKKLDDGLPLSGIVLGVSETAAGPGVPVWQCVTSNAYTIGNTTYNNLPECSLTIKANF